MFSCLPFLSQLEREKGTVKEKERTISAKQRFHSLRRMDCVYFTLIEKSQPIVLNLGWNNRMALREREREEDAGFFTSAVY